MPPGRLPAIFAVVALNIFYWYVTPLWLANLATLVGAGAPSWLAWRLRAGLLAASVLWLWRGVRKERAFVGRMAEGEGSRLTAGGGLLGLETAYALHKLGLRVTVLERGPWLLRRQLDARAAALLASYLHGLGLEILFQTEVAALVCDDRVRVATLKSGEDLACEVFVVCAGIVPQVELACRLGLAVGRGIRVDARMARRDAAIFAAGDCAEFDGEIAGLWPTAVEQGRVAGAILIGCPEWSLGVQRALKGGRDPGALAGQLTGDDPAVFG